MRYVLICSVLLLITPLAHAVSESDFAYGYTLEVDGDGAIYSLALPEAVYRGLTRADRGDLRVFNSRGISVPHHIKRAKPITPTSPPAAALPLFPLYAEAVLPQMNTGDDVHIVTNDKGAIIDINYGKPAASKNRRISAYLLDCSQLKQIPNALLVNWRDNETGFVINAEVEGSDDLSHWQPIIVRTTLSNLQYGDHTLVQRRIDLPLHKFRYLRLRWLDNKSLQLAGVEAMFPASDQSQDRQWSDFDVTHHDDKNNTYYFDTHSVLPVDRANIDLPKGNILVQASLASASSDKGPWVLRYQGLLYDLQIKGNELRTPAQVLPVTTQRYWRLQLEGRQERLQGKPVLHLGWVPEQLYFVARGEAPFTLAYGSARVGPADTPLAQLLNLDKLKHQQQFIKPAQLGSRIELGNKDKLKPAGQSFDWKQIILWLVLIFGIAALAAMALRLYKQMDQTGPSE